MGNERKSTGQDRHFGFGSCCAVESIVTIDERGQMVLPKDIREKAGITPGAKMALVSWKKKGKICCISMIPVHELTDMVKQTLGPLMQDVL